MAEGRLNYKFVEISAVTDDELTRVVNEMVENGWDFQGIHFAMRETQRRPSMAFVAFTKAVSEPALDSVET